MKLNWKSTELLIFVVLCLFSLRVLNWFEYPRILIGGDFRPPLNNDALLKRVVYTWEETDFGMPSVYSPRILGPFYFFITTFQSLGADLYAAQVVTVFLIYLFSSLLMYVFAKEITGDTIASFVAALYLTSNVYLINDREATAIGYMDTTLMILPCLVTFTKGIKTNSYKLMAVSGILCVLTHATFPNYRTTFICLILVGLISLFFFIGKGLRINLYVNKDRQILSKTLLDGTVVYDFLKLLLTFGIAFLLASIWVISLTLSNFDILTSAFAEISKPWYTGGLPLQDVTRLIVRWGLKEGITINNRYFPYVPYANDYMSNLLMVILCYIPAILAVASFLLSKKNKITIFFGSVALICLFLTSGFNFSEYGKQLYITLISLPIFVAFREASNWIFFVIIAFCILIGCTTSALWHRFRKKSVKFFTLSLVILLFLFSAYPLTTGDVSRNWLSPNVKGSYVPSFYYEIDNIVSNNYWTMLLPQRVTYVSYNFSEGILACGNPYPLLFSKPIISGVGTEYLEPENKDLLNEIHDVLRRVHKENIALEGVARASTVERSDLDASKAIDGLNNTRWSSKVGVPQWLEIEWNKPYEIWEIKILFESAYARKFSIYAWNHSSWKNLITVENNDSTEFWCNFSEPVTTEKLRFLFTEATIWRSISIWELEVFIYPEEAKFLGMLGIKYLVLEKSIIRGNTYDVNSLRLQEKDVFTLIKDWNDAALFENTYTLEKLYIADNIIELSQMQNAIATLKWNTLKHSVFVNQTLPDKNLTIPEGFVWKQVNPTLYEVNVETKGPFILVLLQNYDERWKASINGSIIPEANHYEVNVFANGWLINATGNLTITIQYETQNIVQQSVIISIILSILFLAFLCGKDIKNFSSSIYSRYLIHSKRKINFERLKRHITTFITKRKKETQSR
jgi:hypothetical protein